MKHYCLLPFLCLFSLTSCVDDSESAVDPHKAWDAGEASVVQPSCQQNSDGTIDAKEMAPVLDQEVSFLVSPAVAPDAGAGRQVDLVGKQLDGKRVWDWSQNASGDAPAKISAKSLAGQWFAVHYPNGKFTAPADISGSTLGVYSHEDTGLFLHGIASAQEKPPTGKLLVVYDAPVALLPYPLTVGKSWSQTVRDKNACYQGTCPYSLTAVYEGKVDASGELRLPSHTLSQVLRVRNKVTTSFDGIEVEGGGLLTKIVRQTLFLSECYGEVARATSFEFAPKQDPGEDFSNAFETRKLGALN